jgi:hypothetical protein
VLKDLVDPCVFICLQLRRFIMTKILTGYALRGLALAAVFAFVDGAVGQLEEIAVEEPACMDQGCESMGIAAGCGKKKGAAGRCNCEEKKPGTPREEIAGNYYCHHFQR